MSYEDFTADHHALSKTPRHKTGTKWHKNFSVKPASFTHKTRSVADAAARLPCSSCLELPAGVRPLDL